jgi:hypothetical protein
MLEDKMTLKKILAGFLIAGFVVSCASTGSSSGAVPPWMLNLNDSFPDEDYLAEIGSGDTRRSAENDAVGALARRFKVSVQADSTGSRRYYNLVKGNEEYNEVESELLQDISTSAGLQNLSNLQYSDPYVDDQAKYHIVAYLDRDATARIYRTMVQKDLQQAESLYERAQVAPTALSRFANLDTALQFSKNAEKTIEQVMIIHQPTARLLSSSVETEKIATARQFAAQELAYRFEIQGDPDGKIAGVIRSTMTELGISYNEAGGLIVRGSIGLEPVEVNPRFKSVRWTVDISLQDDNGSNVASLFAENRENGISEQEAESFAIVAIEKAVRKDFLSKITEYMDTISLGK